MNVRREQKPSHAHLRLVVLRDRRRICATRHQLLDGGRTDGASRDAVRDRGRIPVAGDLDVAVENLDSFRADVVVGCEAFDAACTKLGEISDAARETVAGRIIMAAKSGERDPVRLRDIGIEAVRPRV